MLTNSRCFFRGLQNSYQQLKSLSYSLDLGNNIRKLEKIKLMNDQQGLQLPSIRNFAREDMVQPDIPLEVVEILWQLTS